jgi:UPF0716 family protein affecting phage T7 exclusion
MKTNMGNSDRLIRLMVMVVIVVFYWLGYLSGVWATVLLIVAGIFFLTSLVGYCPLYSLLGIQTNRKKVKG